MERIVLENGENAVVKSPQVIKLLFIIYCSNKVIHGTVYKRALYIHMRQSQNQIFFKTLYRLDHFPRVFGREFLTVLR